MLRGRATTGGIRHGRVNIGYVRVAVGAGQGKVAKVSLHLLLCLWRHRSLRSRCLPTLRLDTSTHSLSASHAMPIPRFALYPDISELPCPPVSSCLRLSPTPCASPLIANSPHKWVDRCSRKVNFRKRNFDFHGSDFTAHRLGRLCI